MISWCSCCRSCSHQNTTTPQPQQRNTTQHNQRGVNTAAHQPIITCQYQGAVKHASTPTCSRTKVAGTAVPATIRAFHTERAHATLHRHGCCRSCRTRVPGRAITARRRARIAVSARRTHVCGTRRRPRGTVVPCSALPTARQVRRSDRSTVKACRTRGACTLPRHTVCARQTERRSRRRRARRTRKPRCAQAVTR